MNATPALPGEKPATSPEKKPAIETPKKKGGQLAHGQERTALAKAMHAALLSNPEFARGRSLNNPAVAKEAANMAVLHADALLQELVEPDAQ